MKSNSEITKASYDKIAQGWSAKNFNSKKITREINIFSSYVSRGGKVLDAGCGPGRHTRRLLDNGYRVVSIDFSKSMLEEARERVPDGDFKLMDMRRLNFPNGSFDGIWCFAAFLHIDKKDAKGVIAGFRRKLKSGGVLGLSVKKGEGERIEKGEGHLGRHDRRFFAYYREMELLRMVEEAGFRVLKVRHRNLANRWIVVFAKKAGG